MEISPKSSKISTPGNNNYWYYKNTYKVKLNIQKTKVWQRIVKEIFVKIFLSTKEIYLHQSEIFCFLKHNENSNKKKKIDFCLVYLKHLLYIFFIYKLLYETSVDMLDKSYKMLFILFIIL